MHFHSLRPSISTILPHNQLCRKDSSCTTSLPISFTHKGTVRKNDRELRAPNIIWCSNCTVTTKHKNSRTMLKKTFQNVHPRLPLCSQTRPFETKLRKDRHRYHHHHHHLVTKSSSPTDQTWRPPSCKRLAQWKQCSVWDIETWTANNAQQCLREIVLNSKRGDVSVHAGYDSVPNKQTGIQPSPRSLFRSSFSKIKLYSQKEASSNTHPSAATRAVGRTSFERCRFATRSAAAQRNCTGSVGGSGVP